MSQQSNEQERKSPDSQDDHLQAFQKRLVLHVLVMDNYTLVNRRSNRIEFNGALTTANIDSVITAIRDELHCHFITESESTDSQKKPCPFCGATPKVIQNLTSGNHTIVGCDYRKCEVLPTVVAKDQESAWRLWNKRS